VPAHNRAGDGHPKPDATLLDATCCFEPYKRLEDALHILDVRISEAIPTGMPMLIGPFHGANLMHREQYGNLLVRRG